MIGSSVISSTSCPVRTIVSSLCRRSASPKPRSRPSTAPSTRLRTGLGLTGTSEYDAGSTTDTLTGERVRPCGVSISSTTSGKVSPIASAISWARSGDGSVTVTSSMTVSGTVFTATRSASLRAEMSSSSSSMAGSSAFGVFSSWL